MTASKIKGVILGLIIAGVILAVTKEASATDLTNIGIQGQLQGQQQQLTNAPTTNLSVEGTDIPRTAATAVAPSTVNAVDCVITPQETAAFSLFFLSFSGTTGSGFNAICYAFKRQQYEVSDTIACKKDKNYALANSNCDSLLAKYEAREEANKPDITVHMDGTSTVHQ